MRQDALAGCDCSVCRSISRPYIVFRHKQATLLRSASANKCLSRSLIRRRESRPNMCLHYSALQNRLHLKAHSPNSLHGPLRQAMPELDHAKRSRLKVHCQLDALFLMNLTERIIPLLNILSPHGLRQWLAFLSLVIPFPSLAKAENPNQ